MRTIAGLAMMSIRVSLVTIVASGSVAQGQDPRYDEVLNHAQPSNPCDQERGKLTTCKGRPPVAWLPRQDQASQVKLAKWALNLNFEKEQPAVGRLPGQALRIAQIKGIEKIGMLDVSLPSERKDRGLVLARIRASMSTPRLDAIYKVGPNAGGHAHLREEFFVVVEDLDPDYAQYQPQRGYKVGAWHIYGIDSVQVSNGWEERFVEVDPQNTGKLRVCGEQHSDGIKKQGAQWLTCLNATGLTQLLRANRSLAEALGSKSLQAAVLANRRSPLMQGEPSSYPDWVKSQLDSFVKDHKIQLDTAQHDFLIKILIEDNPAWMPCGVGCCTADT